jgi:Ca2+-binding EF-hand superfamily protein
VYYLLIIGRITWDELKRVALDLGDDLNDDEVKKMFRKADLDEDGFVTFEDFYNMMTGRVYYD